MALSNKNIKYLRKLRGFTQEEFALKLGIKRSLLGAYEEERAEPRMEVLEAIADMYKLSMDDLLRRDVSEQGSSYLSKRRAQKMNKGAATIAFVPFKAAAGYLSGYADPEFVDELNTFTLPMMTGGDYRAFEIVGDSMMPTPSGSVIVGERVQSLEEVKTNHTYIVVSRTEGIVYKRIVKSPRSKVKYTFVSDNPTYQPYTVAAEDILEVWQAQMILQKANAQPHWDMGSLANIVTNLQQQVTGLKKKLA